MALDDIRWVKRQPRLEPGNLQGLAQGLHHAVGVAAVVPPLDIGRVLQKALAFLVQAHDQVIQLVDNLGLRCHEKHLFASKVGKPIMPSRGHKTAPPIETSHHDMKRLLTELGPMRVLLLGLLLICLPMVFFSDAEPVGAGLFSAYIAPALVILLLCVLLLDALMNRVFAIEQDEQAVRLHRLRMRTDLLAVLLLILFWGGYFYDLLAV